MKYTQLTLRQTVAPEKNRKKSKMKIIERKSGNRELKISKKLLIHASKIQRMLLSKKF